MSLPLFGSCKPKYKSNRIAESACNVDYYDSLQRKSPVVAAMIEAVVVYDDESSLDYSLSCSSLVEDAYFFDDHGSLFRKVIELDAVTTTDSYQRLTRYGSSEVSVTKNERNHNGSNDYYGYGNIESMQHRSSTGRRLSMPLTRRKPSNTIDSVGSSSRGSHISGAKKHNKMSKLRRRLSLGSNTKKRVSTKNVKQNYHKASSSIVIADVYLLYFRFFGR